MAEIYAAEPEIVEAIKGQLQIGRIYFQVLDNGGEPFRVTLSQAGRGDKAQLNVEIQDNYPLDDEYAVRPGLFAGGSLSLVDVDQVWLGSGYDGRVLDDPEATIGNTALIVKGNEVMWVGSSVSVFQLQKGERIVNFVSTVGNSAVPYGYIETNLNYYGFYHFTCADGMIAKADLPDAPEDLDCWNESAKKAKPIPSLRIIIPRSD